MMAHLECALAHAVRWGAGVVQAKRAFHNIAMLKSKEFHANHPGEVAEWSKAAVC